MITKIIFYVGILALVIPLILHFRKKGGNNTEEGQAMENDNLIPMEEGHLKECLDMNNMWIGVCDQKASILLAVMGVVFTIVMTSDTIKEIRNYIVLPFFEYYNGNQSMCFCFPRFAVFVFLVITAIFAALSLWDLLNSIKPNLDYNAMKKDNPQMATKSFIFYSSVANMSYEEFKNTRIDYVNDLRSQVYTNAKIAEMKFNNYLKGFFWFKMMILSAIMLTVSVLLMK